MNEEYICIDIEMSEFTAKEKKLVHGINREVIQIGAVKLDKDFNQIDQFSIYVKPCYSHVTPAINALTGISDKNLENAKDFVSAFDSYCSWAGDSKIKTYCWSEADYKQLWTELTDKGQSRPDLFEYLKSFIDLQKSFCDLTKAGRLIGLDAAVKLIGEEFDGVQHTALDDAHNTGKILSRICRCEELSPKFDFLNMAAIKELEEERNKKSAEYNNSFASFLSPDLLKSFGFKTNESDDEENENIYENYGVKNPKKTEKEEATNESEEICVKYKIPIKAFYEFYEKIENISAMKIVG